MMTRLREDVTASEGGHLPEKTAKTCHEIITADIPSQSGGAFSFRSLIMCLVVARHAARTATRFL
jgi:hypothetical protein